MPPPKSLGKNPSVPLLASSGSRHPLACGSIIPISLRHHMTFFSLCLCILSSFKDTSHWI